MALALIVVGLEKCLSQMDLSQSLVVTEPSFEAVRMESFVALGQLVLVADQTDWWSEQLGRMERRWAFQRGLTVVDLQKQQLG